MRCFINKKNHFETFGTTKKWPENAISSNGATESKTHLKKMNSLITRATANRNSPQIKLQLIRFLHRQHTDFAFAYFFFSFFPKPAGRSVERFFKHKEHQFWAIKRAPKSIHNTTIHKKYVYTHTESLSKTFLGSIQCSFIPISLKSFFFLDESKMLETISLSLYLRVA